MIRCTLFCLALAVSVTAQPVPFYSRSQTANQDAGAGNANFRDITGRKRDNLVPIVSNAACAANEALTGATQKDGYIFGGSCTAITGTTGFASLASTQTFTGGNTFAGGVYGFSFTSSTLSGTFTTIANTSVRGISTMTWLSNGHPAQIGLSGAVSFAATGSSLYVGYLLDGALVNGQTLTKGRTGINGGGNNADGKNVDFIDYIAAPSRGNHTVAIWIGETASGNVVTYPQANSTLMLWVKEMTEQY